jgi:hypothetical protein
VKFTLNVEVIRMQETSIRKRFLNESQIRERLDISWGRYDRLRRTGQLPLRRLGKRNVMTPEDLEAVIANLPFSTF